MLAQSRRRGNASSFVVGHHKAFRANESNRIELNVPINYSSSRNFPGSREKKKFVLFSCFSKRLPKMPKKEIFHFYIHQVIFNHHHHHHHFHRHHRSFVILFPPFPPFLKVLLLLLLLLCVALSDSALPRKKKKRRSNSNGSAIRAARERERGRKKKDDIVAKKEENDDEQRQQKSSSSSPRWEGRKEKRNAPANWTVPDSELRGGRDANRENGRAHRERDCEISSVQPSTNTVSV